MSSNTNYTRTSTRIDALEEAFAAIAASLTSIEAVLAKEVVTPKAGQVRRSRDTGVELLVAPVAVDRVTGKPATIYTPPEDIVAVKAPIGTKKERQEGNRKCADFLRSIKVVPMGAAWTMVKAGERSMKVLTAANKADGLDFTTYAKVGETIKARIVAKVEAGAPAKTTRKSAAKVAAGRQAVQGRSRDAHGRLLPTVSTVKAQPSKVDALMDAGFTRAEALKVIASLV